MRVLFAAVFALLGAGAAPVPRSSNVRSAMRSDDVLSRFRQLQAEVALLQVDDGERAQEVETVEQTVEQLGEAQQSGAKKFKGPGKIESSAFVDVPRCVQFRVERVEGSRRGGGHREA